MIRIQLYLATGVLSCLAATTLSAQAVADVPAEAPEKVPAWVRHDTSLVTDVRAPALKFSKADVYWFMTVR